MDHIFSVFFLFGAHGTSHWFFGFHIVSHFVGLGVSCIHMLASWTPYTSLSTLRNFWVCVWTRNSKLRATPVPGGSLQGSFLFVSVCFLGFHMYARASCLFKVFL